MNSKSNATMLDYPDFDSLPYRLKEMLLISEAHFSGQAQVSKRRKRPLTFGEFVAGVYKTWGEHRGSGIIQLALKAHVIEFCDAKGAAA